jgi:hypothetical protein
MFEGAGSMTMGPAMGSLATVRAVIASLALVEGDDDTQRIDLVSELESLKAAAAAAQARRAVAFADSQEAAQVAGESRDASEAGESPPRSHWPGASRPIEVQGTSASPGRSCARCR